MRVKPQINASPAIHILFSRPLVERQSLTVSEDEIKSIGLSAHFRGTHTFVRNSLCQGICYDVALSTADSLHPKSMCPGA